MDAQYHPLLRDSNSKSKSSIILLSVACILAAFVAGYFEGKHVIDEQFSQNGSEELSIGIAESFPEVEAEVSPQDLTGTGLMKVQDCNEIAVSVADPPHKTRPNTYEKYWKVVEGATPDEFAYTKAVVKEVMSYKTDEQRSNYWIQRYYFEWGVYPLKAMDSSHAKMKAKLKELIKACYDLNLCKFDPMLLAPALELSDPKTFDPSESEEAQKEYYAKLLSDEITKGVKNRVDRALDQYIAKNVAIYFSGGSSISDAEAAAKSIKWATAAKSGVKFSEEEVTDAAERLFAKSPSLLGGLVSKEALIGLANPAVGIAEVFASFTTDIILKELGVTDPTVVELSKGASGILAAMAVGGMLGGPIGAAAALGVGAVSWAIGQGINALFRTERGPNDNWVYLKVGELDPSGSAGHVLFKTYKENDIFDWVSYADKKLKGGYADYMSSGQGQKKPFQLKIWDEHGEWVKTIAKVYYRDIIWCSRIDGTFVVVMARGGFDEDNAGKIERWEFPAEEK